MSNYSGLKQDINNNIYENQTQQITGTVLNAILNEMTASLGAGYQFAGVATLGMNPGDPDQRVFYLAGEGIYTSFGGLQVPAGKLGVLKWDNRWTLQTIDGLGGGGANLTGYVSVASTDDLPDEGQPTLGYLCGTNLYLYVGEGGDTKEGKYQDCGSFRGPEGAYIQDIEQTETSHENGGRNTIKMTLSDGRSFNAYVHNGTTSSGLFPTVAALQAAYPNPVVGQYAFVGAGFPADIYVCTTAGTWTDSGEDYDGDNVDLTDYATKAEVNQLEAEVHNLSGKYYGLFASSSLLPEGDTPGYAFVGIEAPFAIWNFDGDEWADTGATIDSVQGEPGTDGVGFASVSTPTPADGTATITLSNGDTITLDLNHNHEGYYSKVLGGAMPVGGFLPDVVYSLGTLSGAITFSLASPVTGNVNHYFWIFDTGVSAPTVTWPAGLTWADGSAPTVSASKHYEISILGGVAMYLEV